MQKWEHIIVEPRVGFIAVHNNGEKQVIKVPKPDVHFEYLSKLLSELGRQGWELTTSDQYIITLKRPLP